MRIQITTPTWPGTRTGTAREAFGRGRYHVTLDGETRRQHIERPCVCAGDADDGDCAICDNDRVVYETGPREHLFTARELAREDGGRL